MATLPRAWLASAQTTDDHPLRRDVDELGVEPLAAERSGRGQYRHRHQLGDDLAFDVGRARLPPVHQFVGITVQQRQRGTLGGHGGEHLIHLRDLCAQTGGAGAQLAAVDLPGAEHPGQLVGAGGQRGPPGPQLVEVDAGRIDEPGADAGLTEDRHHQRLDVLDRASRRAATGASHGIGT